MGDEGVERRLAAILAADVADYTRLMEEDEDATIEAWRSARAEIIDPNIRDHKGRIVKHTGDGFLAEFPTVHDAVICAFQMQTELSRRNAGVRDDRRMDFRMGVNMGDIVVDEEDIYGDGVNIASRLEGLADPGGICVSGDVYNQVRKRLDLKFEDMGVNGGGIMLHARRPGGPVAAAQNCATHGPLSVATRGRRCTAWSSMRRFDWRLSTRV